VQDTNEKLIEVGVAVLCGLVAAIFFLESSATFWQITNETKHLPRPFWQGFKFVHYAVTNL